MNTASRMESNSEPSRINLSHAARRSLFDQAPGVQAHFRGEVPIKGKPEPERCFWLVDSDENRSRCGSLRLPAWSQCVGACSHSVTLLVLAPLLQVLRHSVTEGGQMV